MHNEEKHGSSFFVVVLFALGLWWRVGWAKRSEAQRYADALNSVGFVYRVVKPKKAGLRSVF